MKLFLRHHTTKTSRQFIFADRRIHRTNFTETNFPRFSEKPRNQRKLIRKINLRESPEAISII